MKMTSESYYLAQISTYLAENSLKLVLEAEKLQNMALEAMIKNNEDCHFS